MSTTALAPSASTKTVAATSGSKGGLASSISLPNLSFSTPKKDSKQAATPSSTPNQLGAPGRWQHPRLDEVIRRRNASNFDSSNLKSIAFNLALIFTTFFAPRFLHRISQDTLLDSLHPYPTYLLYALRALFFANMTLYLLPLVRAPDACEDVPLTPSQRRLLGLPPMSRPATPAEQEQYVTPPRFARSSLPAASTPRSSSSSLFAEASSTPSSPSRAGGSPFGYHHSSGSPFGPGSVTTTTTTRSQHQQFTGAREWGPAVAAAASNHRRLSFHSNRSSPLSVSEFEAAGSVATPTKGARTSVGLNNKWLYEKGRGSPMASPGRGSLFS